MPNSATRRNSQIRVDKTWSQTWDPQSHCLAFQLAGAIGGEGPTYKPTIGPGRITKAPKTPYRPTMAAAAMTTTTLSPVPWYVGGASYQTTVKPVDLVTLATPKAQVKIVSLT